MTFTNQLRDNMGAVMVWFALIFAVAVTIHGATIKTWSAIQKRRHDWE